MTLPPDIFRHVLQGIASGIAICDAEGWEVQFENAAFFQWFPPGPEPDAALDQRLPGLNAERARSRLQQGRPFAFETEVRQGARTTAIAVTLALREIEGSAWLLVECRDASKQKEAEYMLDSYSRMAERNARELQKEKERVEKLLLNVMPRSVYEEMKDFGTTTPQLFDQASVMLLDFVGFTSMAIAQDPGAVVAELNDIFSALDRIVELFGCERIKTIGDAYMAVSGLPEPSPDHGLNIAKVAVRARRYLERRNASHPTEWRCRIGLASGPVIGSMVGIQKYVYDVFGPAVNMAARLEGLCEPMEIVLDAATHALVKDAFACHPRGEQEIKGFGLQPIFTLDSELSLRR